MDIFSAVHNNTKTNYSPKDVQKVETLNKPQNIQELSKDLEEKKSKEEIKKELQQVVEELNKAMNPLNKDLRFSFDDKADELIVKVIDKKSDKVIRQFPPEEALKLMEKMRELVGLLFDKKG